MSQAFEWIRLGGPTMLLLVALSVATVTIVLVKIWEFWDQRIGDTRFVALAVNAWQSGAPDQALTALLTSGPRR